MKPPKRFAVREPEGLPMTPMIDVVFLLLVYFLVTFTPTDVLAHLGVNRPAGADAPTRGRAPVLRIEVLADGYRINGAPVSGGALNDVLARLAGLDRRQMVLIACSRAAPHERLVNVLNICARHELSNLSVVSVN